MSLNMSFIIILIKIISDIYIGRGFVNMYYNKIIYYNIMVYNIWVERTAVGHIFHSIHVPIMYNKKIQFFKRKKNNNSLGQKTNKTINDFTFVESKTRATSWWP